MLLNELRVKLYLRRSALIGCRRQSKWAEDDPGLSWRMLRGNSLLIHAADSTLTIDTPAGFVDIPYRYDDDGNIELLQFRGGTWKPWWVEDIQLLLAIVQVYTSLAPVGCTVLREDQGELTTKYIASIPTEEARVVVEQALLDWKNATRIAKNTVRAFATCPYCPVRERCDSEDLQSGNTADWSDELTARR